MPSKKSPGKKRDYVQVQGLRSGDYYKIDRATGATVHKASPGPYKGIPIIGARK